MPRMKRPLAELDSNASRLPPSSKRLKKSDNRKEDQQESSKKYTPNTECIADAPSASYEAGERKETFHYETKDNSRLRTFLADRGLSTSGTRNELIRRLEISSIDYEQLPSAEISEMLKRRGLTNAHTGSKSVKIERLRLNDEIDRETGPSGDTKLYAMSSVYQMMIPDLEKRASSNYSSETAFRLTSLLRKAKLPCDGTRTAQIARLRKYDRKRLKEFREKRASVKAELEEQIGHAVDAEATIATEDKQRAKDNIVERDAANARPGNKVCDYDWKDSHWASRTERELLDICARREMPGQGPKAAMLKWLDTGSVEYEDLYAGSLEIICFKRGLKSKSGEKKVDLVERLKDADEADAAKKALATRKRKQKKAANS